MIRLVDDYGRVTTFHGEEIASYVAPGVDEYDRVKPQRTSMYVWRTRGLAYVVKRVVTYQTNHATQDCVRIPTAHRRSTTADAFTCLKCGGGIWAAEPKTDIYTYPTPQDLIDGLRLGPRHGDMSQALLADISDVDPAVAKLWMTQEVK